jgi:hypothetical protein
MVEPTKEPDCETGFWIQQKQNKNQNQCFENKS